MGADARRPLHRTDRPAARPCPPARNGRQGRTARRTRRAVRTPLQRLPGLLGRTHQARRPRSRVDRRRTLDGRRRTGRRSPTGRRRGVPARSSSSSAPSTTTRPRRPPVPPRTPCDGWPTRAAPRRCRCGAASPCSAPSPPHARTTARPHTHTWTRHERSPTGSAKAGTTTTPSSDPRTSGCTRSP